MRVQTDCVVSAPQLVVVRPTHAFVRWFSLSLFRSLVRLRVVVVSSSSSSSSSSIVLVGCGRLEKETEQEALKRTNERTNAADAHSFIRWLVRRVKDASRWGCRGDDGVFVVLTSRTRRDESAARTSTSALARSLRVDGYWKKDDATARESASSSSSSTSDQSVVVVVIIFAFGGVFE